MKVTWRAVPLAIGAAFLAVLAYNQLAMWITDPSRARWRAIEAAGLGTEDDYRLSAGGYTIFLGRYTTTGRYVGTGEREGRDVRVRLSKPSPLHSWRVDELVVGPFE